MSVRDVARVDLAYGPEPWHVLDVAQPADAGWATPAAIVVHGGAWRTGSRDLARSVQRGLASRGVLALAIEYGQRQPDPASDMVASIRLAVEWLRASSLRSTAGWDGRVVLVGDSAGGHAAMLAALSGVEVDGVASLCGALSLDALRHPVDDEQRARFPGYATTLCGGDADEWHRLDAHDPVLLLRDGAVPPPTFVATSEGDCFRDSSLAFVDAARALGHAVDVHLEPSRAPHSWFLDERLPETQGLLDAVARWAHARAARTARTE